MELVENAAFSKNGKYFGFCGAGGKLRIWETDTGTLKQEYVPNLHLTSPCTCLTWLKTRRDSAASRSPSPKPKKKRKLPDIEENVVAMGMMSGSVLLYSVGVGDVVCKLENGHCDRVNSVTWCEGSNLFSCDSRNIVEWSIKNQSVVSKWKASKSNLTCIAVLPNEQGLLAAGRTIQWWDIKTQKVKQTFTGHAHDITSLTPIVTLSSSSDTYFVSSSKEDRFINVWSLADQNQTSQRIASFLTEDALRDISVIPVTEGSPTTLTAVTKTGVLHIFKHQLNGMCVKPLKPDYTVHIADDSGKSNTVQKIPIIAAYSIEDNSIQIVYGSSVFLTFESISLNNAEKVTCLIRHPRKQTNVVKESNVTKVVQHKDDGTEYVTLSSGTSLKRGYKGTLEVPMEQRLNNLSLDVQQPEKEVKSQPQTGSLTRLLIQGLNSDDKNIINSVLRTNDTQLINNTVSRLPFQTVIPFLRHLFTSMQEKTLLNKFTVLWVKAVIAIHSGQLLASPDLADMFSPFLVTVESRLSLLSPLTKLKGRLDLLVNQIEKSSNKEKIAQENESLLTYQDKDTSEEDDDEMMNAFGERDSDNLKSASDWEEISEGEDSVKEEQNMSD